MYIASGYALLTTFHFVALKQNTSNIEHILTSSLVVGYIYCNIMYLIPLSINQIVDYICIVTTAVILGYISGRILNTKYIISILDKLKIRDTVNIYYWDDILDNNYPMKIEILYGNRYYVGMLHNYESYSNDPHIVLASYVIKNSNNKIIEDYTEDKNKLIILNTANADSVTVLYDKRSDECIDIKKLCETNNNGLY